MQLLITISSDYRVLLRGDRAILGSANEVGITSDAVLAKPFRLVIASVLSCGLSTTARRRHVIDE
jgi:hypothetical protein